MDRRGFLAKALGGMAGLAILPGLTRTAEACLCGGGLLRSGYSGRHKGCGLGHGWLRRKRCCGTQVIEEGAVEPAPEPAPAPAPAPAPTPSSTRYYRRGRIVRPASYQHRHRRHSRRGILRLFGI